ncbi:PIN-like domain-containing protein [Streptomyces sp. 5-10]|uniref:PIN-like domain-containing protein n=1 Tax=Streptomyces sp. 5-10 TaxID=878925 RepID=UPI001CC2A8E7|nr:PIN-like domain-containing protein [Streptomyces sp. 5-10]
MQDDLPLIRQYQAWLGNGTQVDDNERSQFFTEGLVVLDTNVLLNLYEYTPEARNQVLNALEHVKHRLWLPYQVGLEFVRGRHRVIDARIRALREAPDTINRKLMEARQSVLAASDLVHTLLLKYAQDTEAGSALKEEITGQTFDALIAPWRELLNTHVQRLKQEHDLVLSAVATNDPVLPRVAQLFGTQVANPPEATKIRQRVEDAISYRFPNKIPPGFQDAGKGTPLNSAGDYLLWEEIIERIQESGSPKRVMFVSSDVKEDWYESAEPGRGPRPWPMLHDELRMRSGAQLYIETPRHFFQGIKDYLDADINDATYEEIDRAADTAQPKALTEHEAAQLAPPDDLAVTAYRAAGLTTAATREAMESVSNRLFQWWLITVTAQLGRRVPEADEPCIDIPAATRSDLPPAPYWHPGEVLLQGEWPYRTSSWIAPWFVQVIKGTPETDRLILQRLAAQQADAVTPFQD